MAKPLPIDDRNDDATSPLSGHVAPARSRHCPLVENPLPHCYCAALTSLKIPNVITYCQGNYEHCETYQQWRQAQLMEVAPVRPDGVTAQPPELLESSPDIADRDDHKRRGK